ncbi:MAG TPA: hypothetical protein VMU09_12015 [Acidimicrobiales bacterium]|nr:hypothetical protein [Acidimicrobiales bacterium]
MQVPPSLIGALTRADAKRAGRKGTDQMNVNTVGTTGSLVGASSTAAVGTSSTDAATDVDALFPATQSSISGPGSLFGELASLAQSNPDEFKKVAGDIAQKLKAAAANATGDQAKFLSSMADKFGQAAQSGDMSVLRPGGPGGSGGAQHAHHHRHGGSGQASGDSGSSAFQELSQIISSALQDDSSTTSASPA